MLKRISVDDLTLGMHLHAFCGAWLDHPFWRNRFVIEDAKDLALIRASSIREVWIDAGKGLDVASGQAHEEAERVVVHPPSAAPTAQEVQRTTCAAEASRAARICARSKEAVMSMFQEARMGRAVDAEDCAPLVEEISASVARNPGALISLARLKTADDYTYMHSVAVCALMIALARQLGLSEEETRDAGMAGLLHDLGKMAIPPEILNKPGKLTDDEFVVIKGHPAAGHEMLKAASGIRPMTFDVCLHHHEKIDGSGYPERLTGEHISLYARMGAVCDVYDAITSNRPYKNGWDPAESLRRMAEWKGHFDPAIFQAFVRSLGIYPTGSLVRLESGRLGVVVEQSEKSLLTPQVKVFFSTKANARIPPQLIDLAQPGIRDKIAAREDPARWNFPDLDDLWSGGLASSLR